MTACARCGSALLAGDKFCGECGSAVEREAMGNGPAACRVCGAPVRTGARFCIKCGAPIDRAPEDTARAAQSPGEFSTSEQSDGEAAPASQDRAAEIHRAVDAPRYGAQSKRSKLARWPVGIMVVGCLLAVGVYFSLASVEDDRAHAVAPPANPAGASVSGTLGRTRIDNEEFSIRRAFIQLYGQYDPNLDGAFWRPKGAPRALAAWEAKPLFIRPLISRSFRQGDHARQVVVTYSLDVRNGDVVKQGTGCADCGSLIGAAVFERMDQGWRLISRHDFLTAAGSWGAPPKVSIAFRPAGGIELQFEKRNADPRDSGKRIYTVVLQERSAAAEMAGRDSVAGARKRADLKSGD